MKFWSLIKRVTSTVSRTGYCRLSVCSQSTRHTSKLVLPLIDFSPFATDDENHSFPKDMVDKLAHACEHVGFFYAIGHGVPNELLTRTLSVTREFFDLSEDIKNRYAVRQYMKQLQNGGQPLGGFGRGYQSVGENVTNKRRDRHEGFDLYRELNNNHPLRRQFELEGSPGKTLPDYRELALGRNPWPKECSQFQITLEEYVSAMLRAGERVMRAMALSLSLPLNYFRSSFNDSFWVLRCIHYPAVSASENDSNEYGEGCGEHSDYGWLTFVNQDLDSRNCLHVRSNDPAVPSVAADPMIIDGQIALTCNIGDSLGFFTNNKYRSTRHRVISPSKPARSRVSVPFFFEPNLNVKIKTSVTSPECYFGEYLTNKVRNNFQFHNPYE